MGPKLRWVTVEQFESLGLGVCGVLVRTAEIRRSCGDPAEIGGGRSSFSIVRYRPGEGDCRSAPRPRRWIFLLFLPRVSPAFGGREIRPLGKAAEMQRRRGGAWGTPQPSPPTSLATIILLPPSSSPSSKLPLQDRPPLARPSTTFPLPLRHDLRGFPFLKLGRLATVTLLGPSTCRRGQQFKAGDVRHVPQGVRSVHRSL